MHRFTVAALSLALPLATAGKTTLSEAGAKNIGSSAAYVAICEKEGLIAGGTLAEFMFVLREGLTEQHWEAVKSQYQASLHEKQQYSIAKDQWIPFNVSAANCRDLEKAIPLVISSVKRNAARRSSP